MARGHGISLLGNFRRNTKGSIAVMFGASAVPIAIAASVALDMANVSDVRSQLQAAADTAVLAAATRLAVNADDSDKEALARTTFDANLSAQLIAELTSTPDVDVDFPSKTVSMAVEVTTGTVLTRLVTDEITVHVNASATVSPGTPICMMALNPDGGKVNQYPRNGGSDRGRLCRACELLGPRQRPLPDRHRHGFGRQFLRARRA